MTPFLDMVLNGPMDESAASGGMFTHLDGITRNGVLITEQELLLLVNFARQVRRTSCEDLDTRALDSLLNCLPVVESPSRSSGSGRDEQHVNGGPDAAGLNNGDCAHGIFGAGLKRNIIHKGYC
jgi:hypothetical protein